MSRPTRFTRGGSFSHTFDIPPQYVDGSLTDWLPLSQVRVHANRQPDGLVHVLECKWVDKNLARKITVSSSNTDSWPVGLLEVDVLLTSPSGENARVPKLIFECVGGVTEVTP